MKMTPMEIQQKQFRIRFRGFDVQEVDDFLEHLADEIKTLFRKTQSSRRQ